MEEKTVNNLVNSCLMASTTCLNATETAFDCLDIQHKLNKKQHKFNSNVASFTIASTICLIILAVKVINQQEKIRQLEKRCDERYNKIVSKLEPKNEGE